MDTLEKNVLKIACSNLRRATEIPRSFANLDAYMEWIRNANRAATDFVNIVDTLIKEDSTNNEGPMKL